MTSCLAVGDAAPGDIMVIKLGALGDFVLAFAAFAAIRAHHPGARITLLTTAPYAGLAAEAPWFDAVAVDARPRAWQVGGLLRLRRQLRGHDRIYDLQTSGRSSRYFWLAGRPEWSGIGRYRRFPDVDPRRDTLHTLERQRGQLRQAGIAAFPAPDLGWLTGRAMPAKMPLSYALLVPGAAPHRPDKCWPAVHYAGLAARLAAEGIAPVLVGGPAERPLGAAIQEACSDAIDLTGRTELADIAVLAKGATLAVGNDTGPMHLAAAVGCRCVVLFGGGSDPRLTAPRGPGGAWPTVVQVPDLAALPPARVAAAIG